MTGRVRGLGAQLLSFTNFDRLYNSKTIVTSTFSHYDFNQLPEHTHTSHDNYGMH